MSANIRTLWSGGDMSYYDKQDRSGQKVTIASTGSGARLEYGLVKHTNIIAKTSNYTVKAAESGAIFTTTGATGAVTFTLPSKASGLMYRFINTVDQNMTIVADVHDTMLTFNDVAADSVAFSTASEKIGACVDVICDGTKWIVIQQCTNTMTVAT